jgi:HD-GYP domain-containing protein (c-di-GMP phosphodiesterase class II)
LAGEEIPLGARIIAVADAYDAMTTDRPYRTALSKEVAVVTMKNKSGTQFDERVVEHFVKLIKMGRLHRRNGVSKIASQS